jgi:very-short-patch-repair endonuclease
MTTGLKSPKYIIELAKEMRNNMTETEELLWSALNKRQIYGLKFRRQHPVYRYILDFYCYEKQLAIVVDGEVHKKQKDNDIYRDEFLKSIGIRTIRIRNEEIINNLYSVIEKIKQVIY